MTGAISGWILRLLGAALISSAALTLAPEGGAKRAVRFACGLLSVTALLSVGLSFNYEDFSKNIAEYRKRGEEMAAYGTENAMKETRFIIESRSAEYILDKAAELGLSGLSASVKAEWAEEGFWYPVSVSLTGSVSESGRRSLAAYIESELGIPKERQIWGTGDEN